MANLMHNQHEWQIIMVGIIILFIGLGALFYYEHEVSFLDYIFRIYPFKYLGLILTGVGGLILILIRTKFSKFLEHIFQLTIVWMVIVVLDQLFLKLLSNTLYDALVFYLLCLFIEESNLYLKKGFSGDGDMWDHTIGFILILSGFALLFFNFMIPYLLFFG